MELKIISVVTLTLFVGSFIVLGSDTPNRYKRGIFDKGQAVLELMVVQSDVKKALLILESQAENINILKTMIAVNRISPNCIARIKDGKTGVPKCWTRIETEVAKAQLSPNVTTNILTKTMDEFIADSYGGDKTKIPSVVNFIQSSLQKGSDRAISAYTTLFEEMNAYGHLYFRDFETAENNVGGAVTSYHYRAMKSLKDFEGLESAAAKLIPPTAQSILNQSEFFIRNNDTGDYMYSTLCTGECKTPEILADNGNGNDPHYLWKFEPGTYKWNEANYETFYIVNSYQNTLLTVSSDRGLTTVERTPEKLKSTWAMFYVHFLENNQVVIQCSYWGMKTLGLESENGRMVPKLSNQVPFEQTKNSVWILQPNQ